jgi:hypothetical protein
MAKILIWIVVIIGLLPITVISIVNVVFASFIAARQPPEASVPEATSFVSDVSIQIGSPSTRLHLSTHPWPAAVVLVGVAIVIVGLAFLLPGQPDRVRRHGLLKIESYMGRLIESRKANASVIVATLDGQHAILIMRNAGRTTLNISADRTKNDDQEAKMRGFFRKLGMTPDRDYRSPSGGVEDAACNFEFQLTNDPKAIARLCASLCKDLFSVTAQDGLEFTKDGF